MRYRPETRINHWHKLQYVHPTTGKAVKVLATYALSSYDSATQTYAVWCRVSGTVPPDMYPPDTPPNNRIRKGDRLFIAERNLSERS